MSFLQPGYIDSTHASVDESNEYFSAVRRIKKEMMSLTSSYVLEPVLVCSNVDVNVLEEFPQLVGDVHVKLAVWNGSLYITGLATADAHGCAVSQINTQAIIWSRNVFTVMTDTVFQTEDGGSGSAPDLVIKVPPGYLRAGEVHNPLVIVEVEISHRSVLTMRSDFAMYFQQRSVRSVIVLKLFPRDKYIPIQRAMAVQWTRQSDGTFAVDAAWDCGILTSSPQARASFSSPSVFNEALQVLSLPPVPEEMWNRSVPVAEAFVMNLPLPFIPPLVNLPLHHTRDQYVQCVVRYIQEYLELGPTLVGMFNGGQSPTMVVNSESLVAYLNIAHVAVQGQPIGQFLGNFTLDVGMVLYSVQRGVLPL